MLTETVTITQRGQNRMLVRWESPKCQTAYRLLSPCNLNSQHQSDKLSDRPREWRTCLRRTHVQRQQWKKEKKKREKKNPNPTYHDGRKRGDVNVLTRAGAERRVQPAQQYPSVLNLLEWFVSWLRDWGSATSSFEGSAEVTAQTLFTVRLRVLFFFLFSSLPSCLCLL